MHFLCMYLTLAYIKARAVNLLVLITLNVFLKKKKGTIYKAFNEVKIRV